MQSVEQERFRHRFQPGQSGNPRGRISRAEQQACREATVRELAAELGLDAPSASERILLDQVADLVQRRARTAEDAVRIANSVDRILRMLRRKAKREPQKPALDAYLGEKYGPAK